MHAETILKNQHQDLLGHSSVLKPCFRLRRKLTIIPVLDVPGYLHDFCSSVTLPIVPSIPKICMHADLVMTRLVYAA